MTIAMLCVANTVIALLTASLVRDRAEILSSSAPSNIGGGFAHMTVEQDGTAVNLLQEFAAFSCSLAPPYPIDRHQQEIDLLAIGTTARLGQNLLIPKSAVAIEPDGAIVVGRDPEQEFSRPNPSKTSRMTCGSKRGAEARPDCAGSSGSSPCRHCDCRARSAQRRRQAALGAVMDEIEEAAGRDCARARRASSGPPSLIAGLSLDLHNRPPISAALARRRSWRTAPHGPNPLAVQPDFRPHSGRSSDIKARSTRWPSAAHRPRASRPRVFSPQAS